MSLPNELLPVGLLAGGAGTTQYRISRSLRFNSADSAYLSRTPSVAGNRKTWTWAGWVKRSGFANSNYHILFCAIDAGASAYTVLIWNPNDDRLSFWDNSGGPTILVTNQLFRDPSAWYHVTLAIDTTQASASSRAKLYVNGSEVTSFATDNRSALSQNYDTTINRSGWSHSIGSQQPYAARYFDGYLADIHFIDGQALTPSSFGQTDSNGVWQPKAYTGTYGTNGFRLDFADNSAATAAALGKDTSGNGNNWTPTNLSVTAGAGNDSLVDSPTNYGTDTGAGGEVRGNYATLNPLDQTVGNGISLANGNLDAALANASIRGTIAIPSSGKWYFEWVITKFYTDANGSLGIGGGVVKIGTTSFSGVKPSTNNPYDAGGIFKNSSKVETVTGMSVGDVFGIAIDMDSLTLRAYRNGSTYGASVTLDAATYVSRFDGNGNNTGDANAASVNFGQRPFAYAAPSGFKALCTQNLPTPTIPNGKTAMDVVTYTGNGSTQTISGLGFGPDLVWLKARSAAQYGVLYDAVRGAGTAKSLLPALTESEGYYAVNANFSAFNVDGFDLGSTSSTNILNSNSTTYVAWAWDAGTTTVTNTAGSITSQVRANASAGISIVSYTGNGSGGATVGHGLGVAPPIVIAKSRNNVDSWVVYTNLVDGSSDYLLLNTTDAKVDSSHSAPTSTVFNPCITVGPGISCIAYCFAPVAGFSAFGRYTGNGSADGPFVYLGFRPRWILYKRTDTTYGWSILDSARDTYNAANTYLAANTSGSEVSGGSSDAIDFTSNGFKVRATGLATNASGGTYIYAAFAESPFQYARAR